MLQSISELTWESEVLREKMNCCGFKAAKSLHYLIKGLLIINAWITLCSSLGMKGFERKNELLRF